MKVPKIFHELIIKGDDKSLRGFLWGYKMAKRIDRDILFVQDWPIKRHHIKETLTFRGDYVHLLCAAMQVKGLIAAIARAEALDFRLISEQVVTLAHFEFKFETFSKDSARKLKQIFRRRPAGVTWRDFDPEEIIDPRAKGVELYSQVHDYTYRGHGTAEGQLDRLLQFHAKLEESNFIDVTDITIEH